MSLQLPPKPDFAAIEAAAPATVDRRTLVLALIGNVVFSWSNNESMFIYILMILMQTDEASAAIVFSTLNTTRARIDLIQRLAAAKVRDRGVRKRLDALIDRFNDCTRERNEFNHCMYTVNAAGEITHTQSLKIIGSKTKLRLGDVKAVDDRRLRQIGQLIAELKSLNRDLWDVLSPLQTAVADTAQPEVA
jgi:hypothetical protein